MNNTTSVAVKIFMSKTIKNVGFRDSRLTFHWHKTNITLIMLVLMLLFLTKLLRNSVFQVPNSRSGCVGL